MKRYITILALILTLASCKKDKDETTEVPVTKDTIAQPAVLSFDNKVYEKKSLLGKKEPRTYVSIDVPEAVGGGKASDSINNGIFHAVRGIVHFGEKPATAKSYDQVMASFIASYEEFAKDYTDEDVPWEAKVTGKIGYKNDTIINVNLNYFTFAGGAHGYGADMSLLFDAKTGHTLKQDDLFKDKKGFTALAEKKFRAKYKITGNINSTGYMFENDTFALPQNIFFTDKGLLLLYNPYEAASYADGELDITLPYSEASAFLK